AVVPLSAVLNATMRPLATSIFVRELDRLAYTDLTAVIRLPGERWSSWLVATAAINTSELVRSRALISARIAAAFYPASYVDCPKNGNRVLFYCSAGCDGLGGGDHDLSGIQKTWPCTHWLHGRRNCSGERRSHRPNIQREYRDNWVGRSRPLHNFSAQRAG